MSNLKITTIQADLKWENIDENLAMFDNAINQAGATDVIILPEMFTTGFSMKAGQFAEPMDGKSIYWMRENAAQHNCVITGSLIIRENDKFYNRLIWMRPDGTFEQYDKHQLFKMSGEHHTYTAGKKKLITEWRGLKFCPLVCYDLRFPVWARNVEDYDVLIYTANWPAARNFHWKALLQARAIENQCYTIGVNRCGTDGNDYYYSGDTSVISPFGEILYQVSDKAEIKTIEISKAEIERVRKKIPYLQDRDKFEIQL